MTKTKIKLLRLPKPEPTKEILDERKILVDADEGVTWQKKYFKYGEVVVPPGEDSPWVCFIKTGSLSVMTKLDGIRPQRADDVHGSDLCAWTLSSRCRSGLHTRQKKTAVYKPSVLASSKETPVTYKNQFDMLSKLEERIPGVYNVKKRLGLIDYDAIIAEAKLRLPRKVRVVSATQTDRPVLPPIGTLETGNGRSKPDTRLEASRLRLPHVKQEKNIYLCIPGRSRKFNSTRKRELNGKQPGAGERADLETDQEPGISNRRTTQGGEKDGAVNIKRDRDVPPTFVRLRVLEKGEHFGSVDPTSPPQPGVTVVSNGAHCILLSKSFLSRHRDNAMWTMCGKPVTPYPREDDLLHTVQDERRWQATRRRIFDRFARRTRCRASLIKQFPPSYAGQYSFRTGPTHR